MKHNNPSLSEWLSRIFNLKIADQPSNEVLPYITPTIEVQAAPNEFAVASITNATSANILTSPTGKDLYLTELDLAYSADAAAAFTYMYVQGFVGGAARQLMRLRRVAGAANADKQHISFSRPIKLDRGTILSVVTDSATAAFSGTCTIVGFSIEVTK